MNLLPAIIFGAFVGLSLGLTGGGGSILAVPLLIYGLGMDVRTAVAVSLVVVGLTALFGAVLQARSGQVLWGAGLFLGIGGITFAPLGARIGAMLPDDVTIALFAVIMIVVGGQMVLGSMATEVPTSRFACPSDETGKPKPTLKCRVRLLTAGALTGVLSGTFGVGGGFLLVPALLLVTNIRIEQALATSLVAIALTAASGFTANVAGAAGAPIAVTLVFAGGSAVGMSIGAKVKGKLSPRLLRRLFAVIVVGLGVYMVIRSLLG